MTAQKFYKRGTITAEPFGRDGWLMRELFLMPYVVSDEALKEHFAPLPVIPEAVGEYIKWGKSYDIQLYMMYSFKFIHSQGFKKLTDNVESWIISNSDTFALAWLLGYQIEEEAK